MEVMNIALNLLEQHWQHTRDVAGQPMALQQHEEELRQQQDQHHRKQKQQRGAQGLSEAQQLQNQQQQGAMNERGPLRGSGLLFRGDRADNAGGSSTGDSDSSIEYDESSTESNGKTSSSTDGTPSTSGSTSSQSMSSISSSSSSEFAEKEGLGLKFPGMDAEDDPVLLKQMLQEQEQQERERNMELLAMCSRAKAVEASMIWALEYQRSTAWKVVAKGTLGKGGSYGEGEVSPVSKEKVGEDAKWHEREQLRQKDALKGLITLRRERKGELEQLQQQVLKMLQGFESVHGAHLAELQKRRDWAWGPEAEEEWLAFVDKWEKQLAKKQQQQDKRLLGLQLAKPPALKGQPRQASG